MLYSPAEPFTMDESFEDFTGMGKPTGDFPLFDSEAPQSGNMSLFEDMPAFTPSTWSVVPNQSQGFSMDESMMME